MIFWSAFLVGLFGSFHCIGMCGPIALALPVHRGKKWTLIGGRLLYNLGRTATYMLLGIIFGILGMSFSIAGFQQWASIAGGVLILVVVLFSGWNETIGITPLNRFNTWLKKQFSALFKKRTVSAQFLIGLFNGLLPCGLVYVALAGAIASGSAMGGMLYMLAFGLGTLPLMLAFSLVGNFIGISLKRRMNQVIPYFLFVVGILFILRGLNLGIPLVSPYLEKSSGVSDVEVCH